MADRELRLVLVTPEKTLFDEPVDALQFPLFDGQIGVLPARAPMVGRLGFGELIMRSKSGERRYYIDSGFVQVKGNVVSLLTNDATPLSTLKASELQQQLGEVAQTTAVTEQEYAVKSGREARLRKMISLARSNKA